MFICSLKSLNFNTGEEMKKTVKLFTTDPQVSKPYRSTSEEKMYVNKINEVIPLTCS